MWPSAYGNNVGTPHSYDFAAPYLRAYLMMANKSQLRRNRGEELVNQASCLNLVTNAIIVWNTGYMAQAESLEQLSGGDPRGGKGGEG